MCMHIYYVYSDRVWSEWKYSCVHKELFEIFPLQSVCLCISLAMPITRFNVLWHCPWPLIIFNILGLYLRDYTDDNTHGKTEIVLDMNDRFFQRSNV